MVVFKPNVVRGGRAIGLGNNLYLMKGRTHAKGGIDIGKNPKTGLEVENNEVMQVSPQGIRVFSAQPILGGISPAQYILGGANPNQVFNAQEEWKKINRVNDDGTRKAEWGKRIYKKRYNVSLIDDIPEYQVPLNYDEIKRRQEFMESEFDPKAYNKYSGAKGRFQIRENALKDYIKAGGEEGDLFDSNYNEKVRDWIMDDLSKSSMVIAGNPTDSVKMAKQLAAYNWGRGNLSKFLQKQKEAGIDIYTDMSWIDNLPKETKNYVNFSLRNQDINDIKNNERYNSLIKRYGGRQKAQDGIKKENEYVISSNNKYNLDFLKNDKNYIQVPLKGEKTNKELKEEYKELKKEYRNNSSNNYERRRELQSKIEDVGQKLGESTLKNNRFILYDALWDSNDEESKKYLIESHIRENNEEAKDVLNFYKTYVKSEGLDRILKNQKKYFKENKKEFNKEHNLLFSSPGTNDTKYYLKKRSNRPIKVFDLTGPEAISFYKPFNGHAYVYRNYGEYENNKDNNPYLEVLGHEIGHHFNWINNGQQIGLDINKGYKINGHDERYDERQADVWSMKYLLNHQNIYDSRSNKDVTSEQIKRLREIYPNIRIFRQMDSDEDIAKMLNLVADSGNKKEKTQYNTNYAKYGGIHIKPSKRGTFTAAAKKHGMSVQGFANKVLANKDNYSPAMVKKANFARNASKWKHKEFGGDMDFNYWITKDNIYKLGGRKKALNGTDYLKLLWEENNNTPKLRFSGLNVDIPEVPTLSYPQRNNVSISNTTMKRDEIGLKDVSNRTKRIVNNALNNNSRLESTLQNTIDRNDALRTIASNQPKINKNILGNIGNIGNLIGTGINIAGNLISYGINNRALNRMRRPSMPLPLRAENLQTRVSTAAQEAAIRENVAGQEGLISGNLASSRSRLNAVNRVRNQGTSMYNQLQDRKQNIETELINRNKLNRQQIGNQNVLQFNNWRNIATDFDNKIIDLGSENGINLSQGIADAIAGERGYIANRENDARYRMNAFLTTIANPDAFNAMNSAEIRRLARQFGITNRQLRDLGINV